MTAGDDGKLLMGHATMTKILLLAATSILIAGCTAGKSIGTIAGGECSLPGVHTPEYKVLGKIQYDQNWIDENTEGLVRGCNQPRPKARPASFDRPITKVKKKSVVIKPALKQIESVDGPVKPAMPETTTPPGTKAPPLPEDPAKAKKKHWWER